MAEFLELVKPLVNLKTGTATPYFEDYLYRIIVALGGEGAVAITESDEIVSENTAQLKTQLKNLKQRIHFVPRVKSVDYTAVDNDFVEANQGITVKLPNPPRNGSDVIVANGDGSNITIDGNGKDIKFKAKKTESVHTRSAGNSYHFKWFIDGPYWRII